MIADDRHRRGDGHPQEIYDKKKNKKVCKEKTYDSGLQAFYRV